jgi:ATP-dependent Lon protease
MQMFTKEELVKAVLENLEVCTIAEIQRIFKIPTEEIKVILTQLKTITRAKTCDVSKEIAVAYSLVPKTEQLINRITELENLVAELKQRMVPIRIIKRKSIRLFPKKIKTPYYLNRVNIQEHVSKQIDPEPVIDIEEDFQQAMAAINNIGEL